jgi:hypothetical protein
VVECNYAYTEALAFMLAGRSAEQLTVAELLHAIRVNTTRYNLRAERYSRLLEDNA